ncbi:MAG: alpha/beta hydrolase [Sulfurimonas sp.]
MQKNIDGLQVITHGNKSNQSIIFIHGFPFDHTLWEDVIEDFSDAYYCISYDIRGFGESDVQTGQFTMERYVDDLGHIISALGVEQSILCGFSMGGYIALRAHEKLETKFAALILANTTTFSDNDEAKLKRAAAISSIDKNGVEPFFG